jgi:hypothetical protein
MVVMLIVRPGQTLQRVQARQYGRASMQHLWRL